MSKIIAIAVVTLLTLLSECGSPNSTSTTSVADQSAANEMEVMVVFSGLMVFNLNPRTGSYEVGILSQENSEGHDFCVQRLGAQRVCRKRNSEQNDSKEKYLPHGTKWTLSVTNPPNEIPIATTQHPRRPDVEGSQFDFDWIIDLDGPKFHDTVLDLRPKQLTPIIQLPTVKLFTKYKSPDFVRWQGPTKPDKPEVFGFVAEAIALRVLLKKGEELTLNDEDTKEIVTTVPYVAPSPVGGNYEVVYISNARYPQTTGSDFHMYYNLFSNVDESKWYYFEENVTEPCQPPQQMDPCLSLNPTPDRKPKDKAWENKLLSYTITCCGLICTQIRLVNRNAPLE